MFEMVLKESKVSGSQNSQEKVCPLRNSSFDVYISTFLNKLMMDDDTRDDFTLLIVSLIILVFTHLIESTVTS